MCNALFETISTKPSFYLSCQVDCLFNLKTMAPRKTTVVDQHYLHITQFNFKCVSAFMFSSLLVVSTSLLLSTHWYCTDHHKQNKTKKTKTRVDQHTIFFNNRFNITHAFFKKQLLLPPNFKCVVVHMFSTEYTTVPGSYRVPCYSTVVVVEHHKHD